MPLLAPRAEPRDLVLRAEAAARAGQPLAALSSLAEVMPRLQRPEYRGLHGRVVRLLRSMAPEMPPPTGPPSAGASGVGEAVPGNEGPGWADPGTAGPEAVDPERWRIELLSRLSSTPRGGTPNGSEARFWADR